MDLFFRSYGSGPPLIILHGLYGSSDNWVTIAKKLQDRFTVFLPDLRNHGNSPHSDIHDYESISSDISQLAASLNLSRFFLAGHSMGGKAAIKFALRWPEKIEGLLIADISPFTSAESAVASKAEHTAILHAILSASLKELRSRAEINAELSKVLSEREVGLLMKNLQRNTDNSFSWKLNARSLYKNLDRILEPVLPDQYTDSIISGFPVIFLKGAYSDYLKEKDYSGIRSIFPSVAFITIPEAGHWLHVDNPLAVTDAFLKLLSSG